MSESRFEIIDKRNLVFVGLACIIVAGLLFIWTAPVQALEQFNASAPGERNSGEIYQFTMNNVSGSYEDVSHHFTVYSSKLMEENQSYHYWSVLNGQWLNQTPDKGKKWLFVWVEDYTEGAVTWPYEFGRFSVWMWGNTTISPEPVQMEDLARKSTNKHLNPATIESVTYGHPVSRDYSYFGDPYGWKDGYYQPRIEPGKSNAWSGWIKYQVPVKATLQDIQVTGWFMNKGTATWNLVDRAVVQFTSIPEIPITESMNPVIERRNENPNIADTIVRHRA